MTSEISAELKAELEVLKDHKAVVEKTIVEIEGELSKLEETTQVFLSEVEKINEKDFKRL